MDETRSLAEKYKIYLEKGYIETYFGTNSGKTIRTNDLFKIAEKSECHNTGWPIGVTLTRSDLAPYAIEDGIEAVIPSHSDELFDYWSIKKNGDFYFIRTFQEDEKAKKTKNGNNILWFDVQIWRIAEFLLYCLNLSAELQLEFSRKTEIYLAYHGIQNRVLSCSDPMRFWWNDENYICRAKKFEFTINESVDYLKAHYNEIIYDIASELFCFFGRFELQRAVCDDIVKRFLTARS